MRLTLSPKPSSISSTCVSNLGLRCYSSKIYYLVIGNSQKLNVTHTTFKNDSLLIAGRLFCLISVFLIRCFFHLLAEGRHFPTGLVVLSTSQAPLCPYSHHGFSRSAKEGISWKPSACQINSKKPRLCHKLLSIIAGGGAQRPHTCWAYLHVQRQNAAENQWWGSHSRRGLPTYMSHF